MSNKSMRVPARASKLWLVLAIAGFLALATAVVVAISEQEQRGAQQTGVPPRAEVAAQRIRTAPSPTAWPAMPNGTISSTAAIMTLEAGYIARLDAKLARWQGEFARKCGAEINVATMAEEAQHVSAQIAHLAATANTRGLSSLARKDEQRTVIQALIDRWCRERAPQAQGERCRKAFVFCRG